jgi:2'-5' RNA ligase
MRWTKPLYIMIKLSPARQTELIRLCALLGIEISYSPDRWHCTLVPLGESSPARIAAVLQALRTFSAEPFSVVFDHVEGSTLKPRNGLRTPGVFQHALTRHLIASGIDLPDYTFGLHLNLDYWKGLDRRVQVPLVNWLVEDVVLVESVNGEGRHIEHGVCRLERRQWKFDFLCHVQHNPGSRLSPGMMEGLR